MISNVAINIFLSYSLSQLWGMVNTLQLIVYLPLFNLKFPANLQSFFVLIINTLNLELMNVDWPNHNILRLKAIDEENKIVYSENFNLMGFGSLDFIHNLGLDFYFLLLYFLGLFALACFYLLRNYKYGMKAFGFTKKMFVHAYPLRLLLEAYLNFGFCSILELYQFVKDRDNINYLSLIFALAIGLCLVLYPVLVLVLVHNREKIEDFESKFGLVTEGLNQNKSKALYFQFLFLVRRQLFIAITTFLPDHIMFQLHLFIALSMI